MIRLLCNNDLVFDIALKDFEDENTQKEACRVRKCFTETGGGCLEASFVDSMPCHVWKFQDFVENSHLYKNFFSFDISSEELTGFLSEDDLDTAIKLFNDRGQSWVDPSIEVEYVECVDGSEEFLIFIPQIESRDLAKEFWCFVKSHRDLMDTFRSGKEKCQRKN